ncbi:MAG: NAD(P)H-quinone oxidoreductase [Pseudomonadota bacterium]
MHAIVIAQPGPPNVLKMEKMPVPEITQTQALVKVMASGVNRPDILQRKGAYPPPPGASILPGLEIAGEIIALGDTVNNLAIGDQICALVAGGGYAQYCAVDASLCLPWPKGFDAKMAAALPETVFTVWTNLFDGGQLQRGERVLIHGGSSGIGTAAIQIAKAFDCEVATTVGSAAKVEFCKALGAELVINYRKEDFAEVVENWGKVDLILDMVGAEYFARNLRVLAPCGRLIVIATQSGSKAEIDLGQMMRQRQIITGSTLRPRTVAQKAAIAREVFVNIWPLLENGIIKPVIHAEFSLQDANLAHAMMEESQHIGKIMLINE